MATITIDDAELRELVRKHAQRAAAEYLTNRTVPPYPAYFCKGDWLITWDWLQQEMHELRQLQQRVWDQALRIAALEAAQRPWWKRLFEKGAR